MRVQLAFYLQPTKTFEKYYTNIYLRKRQLL